MGLLVRGTGSPQQAGLVGSPAEKAVLLAVSSWFLQARERVADGNCYCSHNALYMS